VCGLEHLEVSAQGRELCVEHSDLVRDRDQLALAGDPERARISVYAQGGDYHDTVKKALKALGRNKMRTALTMLGMIIGVAAVITMVALGTAEVTLLELTGAYAPFANGGQGVIAMVTNERNGRLVGAVQVQSGEEIMLISDQGTLVRTRVDEVSSLGRNTQGVTLIKLGKNEHLVGLERVQEPSEEDVLEDIEAVIDEDALEKEMPVISTEPSEDELLGGVGDVSPDVLPTDDDN